jgi:hypothetical protein
MGYMTNAEVLSSIDPTSAETYTVPYIYDHFIWYRFLLPKQHTMCGNLAESS